MSCEHCFKIGGKHDYRCPNYIPPKANRYCSYCGEGILDGDEYIENDDGECMHFECIPSLRGLVEFYGQDVKTMYDLE